MQTCSNTGLKYPTCVISEIRLQELKMFSYKIIRGQLKAEWQLEKRQKCYTFGKNTKGQKENEVKVIAKCKQTPKSKPKQTSDWGLAVNMRWRTEYGGHISFIFIIYTIKDIRSNKKV